MKQNKFWKMFHKINMLLNLLKNWPKISLAKIYLIDCERNNNIIKINFMLKL